MVQGNRCGVTFRNFEISLIQKILNRDLLVSFCNKRTQFDNSNNNSNNNNYHNEGGYYDDYDNKNNTHASERNNSSIHLNTNTNINTNINTNTTHKETALQACVLYHHDNIVNKIHTMMTKLSVFVTYGKIPYEKYIIEADKVPKSTSTSTSTSSSVIHDNKNKNKNENEKEKEKETINERERGRERGRGGGTEVGTGNGTIIVTCNTPIANDLKSLQFHYSEGT